MVDRNTPAGGVKDRASHAVRAVKVLVFTLNEEDYAVDISQAKEVLDVPTITKVPYAPDFVRGAINLRGEIISVLDIRQFCGLSSGKRVEQAKVIVTDVTGSVIGVLADQVKGTMDVRPDQIQPPLLTLDERAQRHVKGQVRLEDHILVLLDLGKILENDVIMRLRGTAS